MERIIITFHRDGTFRGASAQDWDGMPVPLNSEQLAALVPDLNAAALARIAELEASPPPPQPAEITIKAWQAKAILEAQGLLADAELVIDSMPDGMQKIAVQSAWRNNADFPRNSETILHLAAALNPPLTESQVDEMFAAGASLAV